MDKNDTNTLDSVLDANQTNGENKEQGNFVTASATKEVGDEQNELNIPNSPSDVWEQSLQIAEAAARFGAGMAWSYEMTKNSDGNSWTLQTPHTSNSVANQGAVTPNRLFKGMKLQFFATEDMDVSSDSFLIYIKTCNQGGNRLQNDRMIDIANASSGVPVFDRFPHEGNRTGAGSQTLKRTSAFRISKYDILKGDLVELVAWKDDQDWYLVHTNRDKTPTGTIITSAWTNSTSAILGGYLRCNGDAISAIDYPRLHALMLKNGESKVPNYSTHPYLKDSGIGEVGVQDAYNMPLRLPDHPSKGLGESEHTGYLGSSDKDYALFSDFYNSSSGSNRSISVQGVFKLANSSGHSTGWYPRDYKGNRHDNAISYRYNRVKIEIPGWSATVPVGTHNFDSVTNQYSSIPSAAVNVDTTKAMDVDSTKVAYYIKA